MNNGNDKMSQPSKAAALIELYFQKGWTDGLPVVPPSNDSVGAMLAAADLRGNEVVGEIPTRNARITAEKVAINAVLAGCLPEYMPVVVAAVKGICHPDYGYHGPATSTGGAAVAITVNGQIVITSPAMCGILPMGATRRKFYPVKFEDYLTGVS